MYFSGRMSASMENLDGLFLLRVYVYTPPPGVATKAGLLISIIIKNLRLWHFGEVRFKVKDVFLRALIT
jgi:hypothetical protein